MGRTMSVSLRGKVGLIVSLIIGISGGLSAYLAYNSSTGALKSSISSSLIQTGSETMDKLDRFLYERQCDLSALAGDHELQAFLASSPAAQTPATADSLTSRLKNYQQVVGRWTSLAVLNNKGGLALPGSDPDNLSAALAKQVSVVRLYLAAATGHSGYSDVLTVAPNNTRVMLFMTPVRNMQAASQPIIGVLVGRINWSASLNILSSSDANEVLLLNAKGQSLGGNAADDQAILTPNFANTPAFQAARQHSPGSGIFSGLQQNKRQYLTAYVPEKGYQAYTGNHWTLILQTPTTVAFAPAQRLTRNLLVIYLAALVVTIVLLVIMMEKQVIQPVMELKGAAGRLAQGNFSQQVQVKSHDELGELGGAFNAMITRLRNARQELARRTRQARGEERLMHTLLNNLPVGVMVISMPSRKIVMMNQAAEKLTGRKQDVPESDPRYKGYPATTLDGKPYPLSESAVTLAVKRKKTVVKDDIVLTHPDDSMHMLRAVVAPIETADGHVDRAVALLEDITEQRELERSRDDFFSIASHELRTPLTAIRGNSEIIQLMYRKQLEDPELKDIVTDIHESASRLIDIVNDFLDTSRLEQKHMTFDLTAVDVVANAESVIKEYQVTGSRQKTHLEVIPPEQPLPKVWADPDRVKQVIINLVGNALKFTKHGSVTVSFAVDRRFVKVSVTDTGSGMTPAAQEQLFKKFGQTGSHTITRDAARSSGLGLYIAKMIIEQMHGRIRLESSAVGVGTHFSFTLPVAPNKQPAPDGK